MTQLSEHRTYKTRDGSRTGIRVEPNLNRDGAKYYPWRLASQVGRGVHSDCTTFTDAGAVFMFSDHPADLIEEPLTDRPFSYEACPVGEDGRRRAVTRDGREVVLLCDDGPGLGPVVGWVVMRGEDRHLLRWAKHGSYVGGNVVYDLLLPPPPKRTVWVNLYEGGEGGVADHYSTQALADAGNDLRSRLGNRAYPIEIEGDAG